MTTKMNFDDTLVLNFEQHCEQEHIDGIQARDRCLTTFLRAALALRSWLRHEILKDKPAMVLASAGKLEFFGGSTLVRLSTGELEFTSNPQRSFTTVSGLFDLGKTLSTIVNQNAMAVYGARALDFLAKNSSHSLKSQEARIVESLKIFLSKKEMFNWWSRNGNSKKDANIIGKLLWDNGLLDKEAFSLSVRVGGIKCVVGLYNKIIVNKESVAQRLKEAPKLAPLLSIFEGKPNTVPSKIDYYKKDFYQNLSFDENVWQSIRTSFLVQGGTPVGWKWLTRQNYSVVNQLRNDYLSQSVFSRDIVSFINEMGIAQVGRIPRFRGLQSMLNWRKPAESNTQRTELMRIISRGYESRKIRVSDLSSISLVRDFIERNPSVNLKNSTWTSLMRRQEVWHRGFVRAELERRKNDSTCRHWSPLIQLVAKEEFTAISLNDSDALIEEGQTMAHCVGGYDLACYENNSRIYSLRKGDTRLATMQIVKSNKGWEINQLYGVRNEKVTDKKLLNFSRYVLTSCKRSGELKPESNFISRIPSEVLVMPLPKPKGLFEALEELDAIPF